MGFTETIITSNYLQLTYYDNKITQLLMNSNNTILTVIKEGNVYLLYDL